MNPTEKITNRETAKFLASLPLISDLWDVFYSNVFLVPHFVILIVNKLTDYFCFYIPAMFMPWAIIFYEIIWKISYQITNQIRKIYLDVKNETVQ